MVKSAVAALLLICVPASLLAQTNMADEMRSVSTPNDLKTRIGPLQFNDGRPTPKAAEQLYEQLDYIRAVDVFLNAMPGAALVAMRRGQRSMGANDNTFVVFEHYLDSKTIF